MVSTKDNMRLSWSLLLVVILGSFLLTAAGPGSATAQSGIDPRVEFVEYWGDYKSVFLFHPPLVKQIFMSIVDLKGNRRIALKHINNEILSCKSGIAALSECRMDQLKLERRNMGISRYILVPINITSVTGHRFKKNKQKYVLTIKWKPLMIQPPALSVDDFFQYLGTADESRYYTAKKRLDQIQINPLFQDRVTIVTSRSRARNILRLYQTPPTDLKDALVFRVETAARVPNGSTASFDLHMKAVQVKINHQKFQTTKELLQ